MKEYKIYIGGRYATTNNKLEISCSHDDKVFAYTYLAGEEEYEEAIIAAEKAKSLMADLPSWKKYEALMFIAAEIERNKEEIARTLCLEACKPIKLARAEVERAVQTFIVAAEESKRLPSHTLSIDWTPNGEGKEGVVKYFPLGIVAGITPFNFPLNLAVHKIAPAIAAGNPIIIKPARNTPLSLLHLAEIINKSSLPKGCLSVLPMDRKIGNKLITDPRIAKLTFTGSSEVGWKMKAEAAKKRITLELGGNAGVIVSPSADLALAVQKCVGGAFAYAGQVCIHAQRLFIHESIYENFLKEFITQSQKLTLGHPLEESTNISSVIDNNNALRIEEWINEAVSNGAKLELGGKREHNLVFPTILTNVNSQMKVCSQEVFGPVVTLEPYISFEKAVENVNNTNYGLQAGVFTNHISEMNYAFKNIHAGGIMINDAPTFRVDHMPYGGVKDSGFGREGIRYAILEMMEPKLMVKNI